MLAVGKNEAVTPELGVGNGLGAANTVAAVGLAEGEKEVVMSSELVVGKGVGDDVVSSEPVELEGNGVGNEEAETSEPVVGKGVGDDVVSSEPVVGKGVGDDVLSSEPVVGKGVGDDVVSSVVG